MISRTILVSDVHGCLEELQELLDAAVYCEDADRLIFLGDLLDRGPDPVGVVRFVRDLGAECVVGNHEEKHCKWAYHESVRKEAGKPNPMRPFHGERLAQHNALSVEDLDFIRSLPYRIEFEPGWFAVHAGFEPATPLDRQDPKIMCRIRYIDESGKMKPTKPGGTLPPGVRVWTDAWTGPQRIIYGHFVHSLTEPRLSPVTGTLCYGIDTGCCFGGRLTAAVKITGEDRVSFVQVPAKKQYARWFGA